MRKKYVYSICEECDKEVTYKLSRHHKDRNHFNDEPSNLLNLCRSCLAKEHAHERTEIALDKRPFDTCDIISRKGSEWYRLAKGFAMMNPEGCEM